jgi:hypothetical protein
LDKNQEKLVFIQKEVEKVVAKEYAIREANLEKNPQAENNEDIFTIILKSNKKMRE